MVDQPPTQDEVNAAADVLGTNAATLINSLGGIDFTTIATAAEAVGRAARVLVGCTPDQIAASNAAFQAAQQAAADADAPPPPPPPPPPEPA
jgi:hypothetical protein